MPPADEMRSKRVPVVWLGENTIVSSSLHAPPRLLSASASVTAAPPVTAIFLSLPPAKNPTHCPSGEKNGPSALSVPRSGSA